MYTLGQIQAAYRNKGYTIYSKPFDLNIFGVRSATSESDKFDDILGVWFHDDKGKIVYHSFAATTDPGKSWLLKPMRSGGTAIMIPDQYKGLYKKGLHKGYIALEQKSHAKYVRDNNKDTKLDFSLYRDVKNRHLVFSDNIKSNIHKAGVFSKLVGNWSAACQVLQKEADFNLLMSFVDKQINAGIGNSFTYTLFESSDVA